MYTDAHYDYNGKKLLKWTPHPVIIVLLQNRILILHAQNPFMSIIKKNDKTDVVLWINDLRQISA